MEFVLVFQLLQIPFFHRQPSSEAGGLPYLSDRGTYFLDPAVLSVC